MRTRQYARPCRGTAHPALSLAVLLLASAWVAVPAAPAAAQGLGPLGEPVSDALLERLEQVSRDGLTARTSVRTGPLRAVEDGEPAADGEPLVLYIGAEFCPYCAVLRWPLAMTLMRFGELSGLAYSRSSSTDVFPDTATFSFSAVDFDSEYVRLQAVELQDREGHAVQRPDDAQRAIFTRLNQRGSIPFLYLGGAYVAVGSPFSPAPLEDLDWRAIVERLESGEGVLWQNAVGETNLLTAALCTLTEQQPSEVCTAPGVEAAAQSLPR